MVPFSEIYVSNKSDPLIPENQDSSRTSSSKMAVFETPSSPIMPRYIPGQFDGIATEVEMFNDNLQHKPQKKNSPFPLSSSAITPPIPPSLARSFTALAEAIASDCLKKRTRCAMVDAVACLMKYYFHHEKRKDLGEDLNAYISIPGT